MAAGLPVRWYNLVSIDARHSYFSGLKSFDTRISDICVTFHVEWIANIKTVKIRLQRYCSYEDDNGLQIQKCRNFLQLLDIVNAYSDFPVVQLQTFVGPN
jgi:hypothetical protein